MGSTHRIAARILVALVTTGSVPAWADEEDPSATRRISFRVERTRDVANDWLSASLAVTDEDADPAALADRVNKTMAWALDVARRAEGVKSRSGGYSTSPVYDQGRRLRRWRASQTLLLESADFEATTRLVGELQSRLQLQSLGFSVSPEKRREVEDELIAEALAAFQARADLVREKLRASGYEIVNLAIETPGGPRPMPQGYRVRAAAAEGAVAPPALEGGTSRVAVGVAATIELD